MKNLNKFHISRSLGPNSQSITKVDHHKAVMTFRNVYEFKKWLVKSGLVWSKTLSMLLSMNTESISMPVFTQWMTSLFDLRLLLSLFAEPKLKLNAKVCT